MKAETVAQQSKMDTKYMKRAISAIVLTIFLLTAKCGEESPHHDTRHTDTDSILFTPAGHRRTIPIFTENTFNAIVELEKALTDSPENQKSREKLQHYCLDTVTGSFLVVGNGTANPEHPPSARDLGRRRAAIYSGERWALYHKAWNSGRRIPFGEEIFGKVMYSKVLMEKVESETLWVLLHVPIGSVVLESPAPN